MNRDRPRTHPRHLRFSQLLKRMIVSGASGAVMVLGLLVAVSQLGIRVGPLLAGLGIAGFIVGFALQEKVLADPEPLVKLHELGDSSVNFVVRPWCVSGQSEPDDEARMAVATRGRR